MRDLLAHPLRPLTIAILFFALSGIAAHPAYLPLPRGRLSDYGNVLDRHGREQISALIEEAEGRLGIEVTILASWEDPFGDIDRYSHALLDAWNLARGRTLFVVFLRERRDWQVRVLSGARTATTHPGLARAVEDGISELVAHRRIEEAMVELFDLLVRHSTPQGVPPPSAPGTGAGRVLTILLFVATLVLIALFIDQRICPRCGRILRPRERRMFTSYQGRNVIYYCRRCGYSRAKKKRGFWGS